MEGGIWPLLQQGKESSLQTFQDLGDPVIHLCHGTAGVQAAACKLTSLEKRSNTLRGCHAVPNDWTERNGYHLRW